MEENLGVLNIILCVPLAMNDLQSRLLYICILVPRLSQCDA